jgi:hypothetical protein
MKMNAKKYLTMATLLAISLFPSISQAAKAPAGTEISACPVTITTSGMAKVTANLIAADTCITVSADDVTIDLDGNTITGPGTFGTYGVFDGSPGFSRKGIRVINGTIKNFYMGIRLDSTEQVVVEGMRLADNTSFGVITFNFATVRNNAVSGSQFGIQVTQGSLVTGNVLNSNSLGIVFSSASTVIGNSVIGTVIAQPLSSGWGLLASGGQGSTVMNNSSRENKFGLQVDCPTNVVGNTLTGNSAFNFFANGEGCNIDHNVGAP